MIHLMHGRPTDLSAVMLADGKWYTVHDPTLPNGDNGYLSFLQYPNGRENHCVMVNVPVSDIKAVAYFGIPIPGFEGTNAQEASL